jgi:CRISPR-associated exonuclease Cas4
MQPPERRGVQDGDDEDRLVVPISALNHYIFCERRAALIHAEGLFPRNRFTDQGDQVHEYADLAGYRDRRGCRTVRAMPLYSDRLGLSGRADLVEFWPRVGGGEEPRPVEYKRGGQSSYQNDRVQLCAQALCLEEMFGTPVNQGSIYHASSRRRSVVEFDAAQRAATEEAIAGLRALLAAQRVPAPIYRPRCHGCSFEPECMPAQRDDTPGFARYMRSVFMPSEDNP